MVLVHPIDHFNKSVNHSDASKAYTTSMIPHLIPMFTEWQYKLFKWLYTIETCIINTSEARLLWLQLIDFHSISRSDRSSSDYFLLWNSAQSLIFCQINKNQNPSTGVSYSQKYGNSSIRYLRVIEKYISMYVVKLNSHGISQFFSPNKFIHNREEVSSRLTKSPILIVINK